MSPVLKSPEYVHLRIEGRHENCQVECIGNDTAFQFFEKAAIFSPLTKRPHQHLVLQVPESGNVVFFLVVYFPD